MTSVSSLAAMGLVLLAQLMWNVDVRLQNEQFQAVSGSPETLVSTAEYLGLVRFNPSHTQSTNQPRHYQPAALLCFC